MNTFATSLMSAYNVSQQHARVALMAVGSGKAGSIPVAYFNSIDSNKSLVKYINTIEDYADFENDGQAIARGLTTAVTADFMRAGYRNEIKNHVIVYITATTKFDDDPTSVVSMIRMTGAYGIVTVGYGPSVTDEAALQSEWWKILLMNQTASLEENFQGCASNQ
ncbi:hypothetical protein OSTOST_11285 [Ostertagia ostertagi]